MRRAALLVFVLVLGACKREPALCTAYRSKAEDPLDRWAGAVSIERGGTVLTMNAPAKADADIKKTIEDLKLHDVQTARCGEDFVFFSPNVISESDAKQVQYWISQRSGARSLDVLVRKRGWMREDKIREACQAGRIPKARCTAAAR